MNSVAFRKSLSFKQTRNAVVIAFCLGVIFSLIQISHDFTKAKQEIELNMSQVIKSVERSASKAAYALDQEFGKEILEGLFQYQSIVKAEILDDDAEVLVALERPLRKHKLRPLTSAIFGHKKVFSSSLLTNVPIIDPDSPEILTRSGELHLVVDTYYVGYRFIEQAIVILISVILMNIFLVISLLIFFHNFLTKPFLKLEKELNSIDPANPEKARLNIPSGHKDNEFGITVKATNRLLTAIEKRIAERVQVEKELREHQKLLSKITDNYPNSYLSIIEEDFTIAFASGQEFKKQNLDPKQFIGLTLEQAYGEHAPIIQNYCEKTFLGEECSFELLVENQNHLYHTVPLDLEDESINRILVVAENITKHKQQENLRRAKEAAEAANQAKSMFLSNMSHELRTPLNAILGFSQMMGRDLTIGEEQREKISIINRSGKHLLSLINDILDIAKIESGRETLDTKSFDLSAFLNEISELYYSRITNKGLFFAVEENDDLPRYIKSDERKLRQVLINLLDNALKFTETGGVTLRVRSCAFAENNQTLLIEVEDTGVGIDSDQLENIFDPFIQAGHVQTDIKGTGLGLAISKSFVELLGGEISVESKPGVGSLFRVGLAVAPAESPETSRIEVVGPAAIGLEPGQPAWRILVVDDDAENRLLLNSLLLQVGFDTRQAKNGEEAVVLFKQWQPHFIWMDMRMPVMDGYAATRKIREMTGGKEVKIVAVTAQAFTVNDEEILATGCDGLVRKPYLEQEIFDTMAQHLGVKYLLGETAEVQAPEKTMPITADMLSELPADTLEELRQAALAANREAISAVLERIEPQSPNIASGLRSLLDGFQIGRIRDLLDAVQ